MQREEEVIGLLQVKIGETENIKKEEKEKIKQRTEKRLAELRVEYLRNEEEQDRLFPS